MEPIVDDGWFMAWHDRIVLTYMDERTGPEAFARYLTALVHDIDSWSGPQRGLLYDTPTPSALSAAQRQKLGELLAVRKQKLSVITAGYVMVTPSAVARGVLTAVFWVAPPPYEYRVVGSVEEGVAWLGTRCSWVDPTQLASHYAKLKPELLARMKSLTVAKPRLSLGPESR